MICASLSPRSPFRTKHGCLTFSLGAVLLLYMAAPARSQATDVCAVLDGWTLQLAASTGPDGFSGDGVALEWLPEACRSAPLPLSFDSGLQPSVLNFVDGKTSNVMVRRTLSIVAGAAAVSGAPTLTISAGVHVSLTLSPSPTATGVVHELDLQLITGGTLAALSDMKLAVTGTLTVAPEAAAAQVPFWLSDLDLYDGHPAAVLEGAPKTVSTLPDSRAETLLSRLTGDLMDPPLRLGPMEALASAGFSLRTAFLSPNASVPVIPITRTYIEAAYGGEAGYMQSAHASCTTPANCPRVWQTVASIVRQQLAVTDAPCPDPRLVSGSFQAMTTSSVFASDTHLTVHATSAVSAMVVDCPAGQVAFHVRLSTGGTPAAPLMTSMGVLDGNDKAFWAMAKRLPNTLHGWLQGTLRDGRLRLLGADLYAAKRGGMAVPTQMVNETSATAVEALLASMGEQVAAEASGKDQGMDAVALAVSKRLGQSALATLRQVYMATTALPTVTGFLEALEAAHGTDLGVTVHSSGTGFTLDILLNDVGVPTPVHSIMLDRVNSEMAKMRDSFIDAFYDEGDPCCWEFWCWDSWDDYYYWPEVESSVSAQCDAQVAAGFEVVDIGAPNARATPLFRPQLNQRTVLDLEFSGQDDHYALITSVSIIAMDGNVVPSKVALRAVTTSAGDCPFWPLDSPDFTWDSFEEFLYYWYWDDIQYDVDQIFAQINSARVNNYQFLQVNGYSQVLNEPLDQLNTDKTVFGALEAARASGQALEPGHLANAFNEIIASVSTASNVHTLGRAFFNWGSYVFSLESVTSLRVNMPGEQSGTSHSLGTSRLSIPMLLASTVTFQASLQNYKYSSTYKGVTALSGFAIPMAHQSIGGPSDDGSKLEILVDLASDSESDPGSDIITSARFNVSTVTPHGAAVRAEFSDVVRSDYATPACANNPPSPDDPPSTAKCLAAKNISATVNWTLADGAGLPRRYLNTLLKHGLPHFADGLLGSHVVPAVRPLADPLKDLSRQAISLTTKAAWLETPTRKLPSVVAHSSRAACPTTVADTTTLGVIINGDIGSGTAQMRTCEIHLEKDNLETIVKSVALSLALCDLDSLLSVRMTSLDYDSHAQELCGTVSLFTSAAGGVYNLSLVTLNPPVGALEWYGNHTLQRVPVFALLEDAGRAADAFYAPAGHPLGTHLWRKVDVLDFADDDIAPRELLAFLPRHLWVWDYIGTELHHIDHLQPEINHTILAEGAHLEPAPSATPDDPSAVTTGNLVLDHRTRIAAYGAVFYLPRLGGVLPLAENASAAADSHGTGGAAWHILRTICNTTAHVDRIVTASNNTFVLYLEAQERLCTQTDGGACADGSLLITPHTLRQPVTLKANARLNDTLLRDVLSQLPVPWRNMLSVSTIKARPYLPLDVDQVAFAVRGVDLGNVSGLDHHFFIPTAAAVHWTDDAHPVPYFHNATYRPPQARVVLANLSVAVQGTVDSAFAGPGGIGIVPVSGTNITSHTTFAFEARQFQARSSLERGSSRLSSPDHMFELYTGSASIDSLVRCPREALVVNGAPPGDADMHLSIAAHFPHLAAVSDTSQLSTADQYVASFHGLSAALMTRLSKTTQADLCDMLTRVVTLDSSLDQMTAATTPLAQTGRSHRDLYRLTFADKLSQLRDTTCQRGDVLDLGMLCQRLGSTFGHAGACGTPLLNTTSSTLTLPVAWHGATQVADALIVDVDHLFGAHSYEQFPLLRGSAGQISIQFLADVAFELHLDFSGPQDVISARNFRADMHASYALSGNLEMWFGPVAFRLQDAAASMDSTLTLHQPANNSEQLTESSTMTASLLANLNLEVAPYCYVHVTADDGYLPAGATAHIHLTQDLCGDGGLEAALDSLLKQHSFHAYMTATPERFAVHMQESVADLQNNIIFGPQGMLKDGINHPLLGTTADSELRGQLSSISSPSMLRRIVADLAALGGGCSIPDQHNATAATNDRRACRQKAVSDITTLVCQWLQHEDLLLGKCPKPPVIALDVDDSFTCLGGPCVWPVSIGREYTKKVSHLHNAMFGASSMHLGLKTEESFNLEIGWELTFDFVYDDRHGVAFDFPYAQLLKFYAKMDLDAQLAGSLGLIEADLDVTGDFSFAISIVPPQIIPPPPKVSSTTPTSTTTTPAMPTTPTYTTPNPPPVLHNLPPKLVEILKLLLGLGAGLVKGCLEPPFDFDLNGCWADVAPILEAVVALEKNGLEILRRDFLSGLREGINRLPNVHSITDVLKLDEAAIVFLGKEVGHAVDDLNGLVDKIMAAVEAKEESSGGHCTIEKSKTDEGKWLLGQLLDRLKIRCHSKVTCAEKGAEMTLAVVAIVAFLPEDIGVVMDALDFKGLLHFLTVTQYFYHGAMAIKAVEEHNWIDLGENIVDLLKLALKPVKEFCDSDPPEESDAPSKDSQWRRDVTLPFGNDTRAASPVMSSTFARDDLTWAASAASSSSTLHTSLDPHAMGTSLHSGRFQAQGRQTQAKHQRSRRSIGRRARFRPHLGAPPPQPVPTDAHLLAAAPHDLPFLPEFTRHATAVPRYRTWRSPLNDANGDSQYTPWRLDVGLNVSFFAGVDIGLGPVLVKKVTEGPNWTANLTLTWDWDLDAQETRPVMHFDALKFHIGSLLKHLQTLMLKLDPLRKTLDRVFGPDGFFMQPVPVAGFLMGKNDHMVNFMKILYDVYCDGDCVFDGVFEVIEKFVRMDASLDKLDNFIDKWLGKGDGHLSLGNATHDCRTGESRTLPQPDPHSTPAKASTPGTPQGLLDDMNALLPSLTTTAKEGLSFPFLDHLSPTLMELLTNGDLSKTRIVQLTLPGAQVGTHTIIGPFPVWPTPPVEFLAEISTAVGVNPTTFVLTLESLKQAVVEKDLSQIVRGISLVVKDDHGRQLYPLFGRVALEGAAELNFEIFAVGLGVGIAVELQIGFTDVEGNGLLSIGDVTWLIKSDAFSKGEAIVAQLEIDMLYELFIEACIPLVFTQLCWTVVDLKGSFPIWQEHFEHDPVSAIAKSGGAVNLSPGNVNGVTDLGWLVSSGAGGLARVTLHDAAETPNLDFNARSVSVSAKQVTFEGDTGGRDYLVTLRGFSGFVVFPSDVKLAVELDVGSITGSKTVLLSATSLTIAGGTALNFEGDCRQINVTNPVHTRSVVATGLPLCPTYFYTNEYDNVTLNGTAGTDYGSLLTLPLAFDTLELNVRDESFTLSENKVTSAAGLNIAFGGTVRAVRLTAHTDQPINMTIETVPEGRRVSLQGANSGDSLIVPDMTALAEPLEFDGGGGIDEARLTFNAQSDDDSSGPLLLSLSANAVVYARGGLNHSVFLSNVELKVVNVLAAAENVTGTTRLALARANDHVLVNVKGAPGAAFTHYMGGSEYSAQHKVHFDGPGNFTVVVGEAGTLVPFAGASFIAGTDHPEQHLTVIVDATADERIVRIRLERDLLSVEDTASSQGLYTISHQFVDRLVVRCSGDVVVDHGTYSAYAMTTEIEYVRHTDDVPPWFLPVVPGVSESSLHVVRTSGAVLVHGAGPLATLSFGVRPIGTSTAPENNCATRGAQCLAHPLAEIHAPVLLVRPFAAAGATPAASGNSTTVVLATGTSPQAEAQGFYLGRRTVGLLNMTTGRSRVAGVLPPAELCARARSLTPNGIDLCQGDGNGRLGALSYVGDGIQLVVTTGGSPDTVLATDLVVPLTLDLGAGRNRFRGDTLAERFSIAATAGGNVIELRYPLLADGVLALGGDPGGIGSDNTLLFAGHESDGRAPEVTLEPVTPGDASSGLRVVNGSSGQSVLVPTIGLTDVLQVGAPLPFCQDCSQITPGIPAPPARQAPSQPLALDLSVARVTIVPVAQPDGSQLFTVPSCEGMPFRIAKLEGAGVKRVAVNVGDHLCAVTILGLRNDTQISHVVATPDASIQEPVAVRSNDGSLHIFNPSLGTLNRLTLTNVRQLEVHGTGHGTTLELNQAAPITHSIYYLNGTKNANNTVVLRGNSGRTAVVGEVQHLIVGQPVSVANPVDPFQFTLMKAVLLVPPTELSVAPLKVSVDAGSSSSPYTPDQSFGADGRCFAQLHSNGSLAVPSELVARYPPLPWWCDTLAALGLSRTACAQTNCALQLYGMPYSLHVAMGGGNDTGLVRNSDAISVTFLMDDGADHFTLANATGTVTVSQPTGRNNSIQLTHPFRDVNVVQGTVDDAVEEHANRLTLVTPYGLSILDSNKLQAVEPSDSEAAASKSIVTVTGQRGHHDTLALHVAYNGSREARVVRPAPAQRSHTYVGPLLEQPVGYDIVCPDHTDITVGDFGNHTHLTLNCTLSVGVRVLVDATKIVPGEDIFVDVLASPDLEVVFTLGKGMNYVMGLPLEAGFFIMQHRHIKVQCDALQRLRIVGQDHVDLRGTYAVRDLVALGPSFGMPEAEEGALLGCNAFIANCSSCRVPSALFSANHTYIMVGPSSTLEIMGPVTATSLQMVGSRVSIQPPAMDPTKLAPLSAWLQQLTVEMGNTNVSALESAHLYINATHAVRLTTASQVALVDVRGCAVSFNVSKGATAVALNDSDPWPVQAAMTPWLLHAPASKQQPAYTLAVESPGAKQAGRTDVEVDVQVANYVGLITDWTASDASSAGLRWIFRPLAATGAKAQPPAEPLDLAWALGASLTMQVAVSSVSTVFNVSVDTAHAALALNYSGVEAKNVGAALIVEGGGLSGIGAGGVVINVTDRDAAHEGKTPKTAELVDMVRPGGRSDQTGGSLSSIHDVVVQQRHGGKPRMELRFSEAVIGFNFTSFGPVVLQGEPFFDAMSETIRLQSKGDEYCLEANKCEERSWVEAKVYHSIICEKKAAARKQCSDSAVQLRAVGHTAALACEGTTMTSDSSRLRLSTDPSHEAKTYKAAADDIKMSQVLFLVALALALVTTTISGWQTCGRVSVVEANGPSLWILGALWAAASLQRFGEAKGSIFQETCRRYVVYLGHQPDCGFGPFNQTITAAALLAILFSWGLLIATLWYKTGGTSSQKVQRVLSYASPGWLLRISDALAVGVLYVLLIPTIAAVGWASMFLVFLLVVRLGRHHIAALLQARSGADPVYDDETRQPLWLDGAALVLWVVLSICLLWAGVRAFPIAAPANRTEGFGLAVVFLITTVGLVMLNVSAKWYRTASHEKHISKWYAGKWHPGAVCFIIGGLFALWYVVALLYTTSFSTPDNARKYWAVFLLAYAAGHLIVWILLNLCETARAPQEVEAKSLLTSRTSSSPEVEAGDPETDDF